MAYTSGFTAVTGATFTASQYNTNVRDNFAAIWVYTTAGDIAYATASNTASRLGIGSTGSLLRSTGSAPAWLAPSTQGSILRMGASLPSWLAPGAEGSLLKMGPFNPSWLAVGSAGKSIKSDGTNPAWEGMRGAAVRRSSSQSISNATYTAIIWDSEDFDNGGFWASGSPTRLTIPRDGHYLLTCNAHYETNSTGVRELRPYKNGVYIGGKGYYIDGQSSTFTTINAVILLYLVSGDYIEMYTDQNSGRSLSLLSGSCGIVDLGP